MPESPTAPDVLDQRLRALSRALAQEAPPAPETLEDLLAGGPGGAARAAGPDRAGPTRRRALLAAAAVVALAGVAGAAVLAGDDGRAELEAGMSPADFSQRLIIESWPGELVADDDAATGRPEPLPTAGFDAVLLDGPPEYLPDGRAVVVGAVPGPDGTEEGITHVLRVVDEDGDVLVERVLDDGSGRQPLLLAATAEDALIVREDDPRRLVAHALATGEEREVALLDAVPFAAEVRGDRVVLAETASPDGEAGGCQIEVVPLDGVARSISELHPACASVDGLRVSPDGRRVAVAYQTDGSPVGGIGGPGAGTPELRITVLDVGGGVVRDEPLGHPVVCEAGSPACDALSPAGYLGLAWPDDGHLRVATVDLRRQPDFNTEGGAPASDAVTVLDLPIP